MDLFRVRLNCVDHYQAVPSSFDPELPIAAYQAYKVPVIRVFGATETGQKVCAHVHGFFPYLYIEYGGSLVPDEAEITVQRFRLSIDHALAVSYRRDLAGSKTAFVAHITVVKGIPFYGYHVGYRYFLKVYLLNPLHITRLADLLRQGAVMGKGIQPYESHMQYIPQWMCDYNLYGCAYLDCSKVKFRLPVPSAEEIDTDLHKWHNISIPDWAISEESQFSHQSHCPIEVDICVYDIANRHGVKQRHLHSDFSEALSPPVIKEKLVPSMESLWRDETKRRRARMGITDPDSSPFPPEVLVSVSAEAREDSGMWIHEEEFRQQIAAIALQEKAESSGGEIDYGSFAKPNYTADNIPTAFESIEDLYPQKTQNVIVSQDAVVQRSSAPKDGPEFDVDDDILMVFADDLDADDSGADLFRDDKPHQPRKQGPTGDYYEDQCKDSLKYLPKTTASTTSSAEQASHGIRDAGDYSHADSDLFDIPDEYTSDITSALSRHESLKRQSAQSSPPSRKRKFYSPHTTDAASSLKKPSKVKALPDVVLGSLYDFADFETDEHDAVGGVEDQSASYDGQGTNDSKPSSQRNGRLPFPVVKDPQNPATLERLSQQSNVTNTTMPVLKVNEPAKDSSSIAFSITQTSGNQLKSPRSDRTIPETPIDAASSVTWNTQPVAAFGANLLCWSSKPPSFKQVKTDMAQPDSVAALYQQPYFSNEEDVPARKFQYAGKEFLVGSNTVPFLPDFDPMNLALVLAADQPIRLPDRVADERAYAQDRRKCSSRSWEVAALPPSRLEVEQWLQREAENAPGGHPITQASDARSLSQIDALSQKHKDGAKYWQKQSLTSVQHETQYMSVMSLEIHVNTRGTLMPNPEQDEVAAIFWCFQNNENDLRDETGKKRGHIGALVLSETGGLAQQIARMMAIDVEEEDNEFDLINHMIDIVRYYDPDVIAGFEVHGGSWGYMIERARLKYDANLCDEFSRMKSDSHGRFGKEADRWGFNQTSTIRVTGRHMINIWPAMRSELNLLQYTMENIVFQLLQRRIPHYAFSDLTRWWKSGTAFDLAKVVNHFVTRCQLDLDILDKNELISRTSEQARLLGVDFFSVFSRGSQFKVESLMFRIAKPENFILISPSRKQVGQQNALECIPLVMEPQSGFYTSPLLVLDFQSLYPSVMIAYNYCYSTFLGRVVDWRGRNKMGFTDYKREARLLELLREHINISPNGMMYTKGNIRKSLLAKMLGEILETRVMVKSGMKVDKDDETLQRLLNNRQLALKFISNVTYGYTSASFSGRMPCSEIADSIVQTGRETLEKAIALIHSVQKWGAEVVYGDTDSLFVYLKGKTRSQAFDIGEEIAAAITDVNPKPIKLKFEKVYHPCVLLAKKRYVGFKYEHRDQKEPEFDAKGIETVRRDGTPAEQKIEERALKVLFRTQDLSQVKSYFQQQCSKIMRGKVSLQDFCFAKEVKLGTYSDKGPPPPGALISTRRMLKDPRAEPQYGERVPYVVVTGAPGARLIDRCVAPEVLLQNDHLDLDADYYISKNLIPPLERIFNLVGANVRQWYDEMPRYQRIRRIEGLDEHGSDGGLDKERLVSKKRTIDSYWKSTTCAVCRKNKVNTKKGPVCERCVAGPHLSVLSLRTRLNEAEKKAADIEKICRSCAGLAFGEEVKCDSKDCPVFYTRMRRAAGLRGTRAAAQPVLRILEGIEKAKIEW